VLVQVVVMGGGCANDRANLAIGREVNVRMAGREDAVGGTNNGADLLLGSGHVFRSSLVIVVRCGGFVRYWKGVGCELKEKK